MIKKIKEIDEKKMNKTNNRGLSKKNKQFKMLTMLPAKLLQLIFLHEINAVREGLKNHRITNTRKKSYYVNTILFVFVFSKDC